MYILNLKISLLYFILKVDNYSLSYQISYTSAFYSRYSNYLFLPRFRRMQSNQ